MPIDHPDRGERGLGVEANPLSETDAERWTVLSRGPKLVVELLNEFIDPVDGDTKFPYLGPERSEIASGDPAQQRPEDPHALRLPLRGRPRPGANTAHPHPDQHRDHLKAEP